jgi:hypothetical protein
LDKSDRIKFVVLLAVLSAVYVFVFGESGVLERASYLKKKEGLAAGIARLEAKKKELSAVYDAYRRGEQTDSDMMKSGYVIRGDRLLYLKGLEGPHSGETEQAGLLGPEKVEISHLRVIWIIVSSLLVLLYYTRAVRQKEYRDD